MGRTQRARWMVVVLGGSLTVGACNEPPREEEKPGMATNPTGADGTGPAPSPVTGVDSNGATTNVSSTGGSSSDETGDAPPTFDVPPGDPIPGVPGIPKNCESAEMTPTTVGCEFYSGKFRTGSGQGPFGLVIANVQLDTVALVEFEIREDDGWRPFAGNPVQIDPMDLYIFSGTESSEWVFRATSTVPVTAYQFRPLDGEASYEASDASMLFPVHDWGHRNLAVAWPHGYSNSSHLLLLSATDDNEVHMETHPETRAQIVTGSGYSPAFTAKGGMLDVVLDDGEMLVVIAPYDLASGVSTDISGTRTESTEPLAMFTGHPCAFIPEGVRACDNLEEQMPPVQLWGQTYVAGRLPVREDPDLAATPESEIWHIIAAEDQTTVTFEASDAITGLPGGSVVLNAGQKAEFEVHGTYDDPGDFVVRGDKPIAVFTYMSGSCALESNIDCEGVEDSFGDPAMVQMSPVEQHLDRYAVLVPPTWEFDYFVLTRPSGAQIEIDGVPVPEDAFVPVGADHEVARVPVEDGVHRLDGDAAFGVVVVGYDWFDSYAYLGGQNAIILNPEG